MINIIVNRFQPSELSTQGVICFDNKASYVSLEPPNPIPAGKYRMSKYLSPRKGEYVLLLHDVPGHSYVEWHVGNYPYDTHNCLLPGMYPGKDAVWNSRVAFNELTAKVFPLLDAGKEVYITYVDLYK